jgi:hypothetical protein
MIKIIPSNAKERRSERSKYDVPIIKMRQVIRGMN